MVVYITKNLIDGKCYIGRDRNNDPRYLGSGFLLKKAIKKYGKENFKKEILEECSSEEELKQREEYWLNYYDVKNNSNFYNLTNSSTGYTSDEVSGHKNYFYGRKHTKEAKDKMRIHRLGKPMSDAAKKKLSEFNKGRLVGEKNGFYGKTHSDEVKKRLSETQSGEGNRMFGKTGPLSPKFKGYLICVEGQYVGQKKSRLEWANFFGICPQSIDKYLKGTRYKNGIKGNFLKWESKNE